MKILEILAYLMLAAIVGLFIQIECSLAESAVVSFNDAEHLAAISDSIVGVCDTTRGYYYNPDCPEDTVWYERQLTPPHPYSAVAWLPNCDVHSWYDSTRASFNWQYIPKTITCRELICVAVPAPQMPVDSSTVAQTYIGRSPGTAIITWREVKQ